MVDAVFQAINDSGSTTLSTTQRPLNLRYRRLYAASLWSNNVLFRTMPGIVLAKSSFVRPVFAFRPVGTGNQNLILMRVRSNATQWIIEFTAWNRPVRPDAVELYVFDDYLPARDNYGIELLDEAGNVMFNSAWPIMRILKVATLPPSIPAFLSGTTNFKVSGFQSTTNVAVCMSYNRDYYHGATQGDGYSLMPAVRRAGTELEFELVCYASESENYPGGGAVPFTGYITNNPVTVLCFDTTFLPAAPFG